MEQWGTVNANCTHIHHDLSSRLTGTTSCNRETLKNINLRRTDNFSGGRPILSRNIIFKVHTYSSKWFSERRCYFSTLEYQQNGSPCFVWIYLGQRKIAGDFDGQRTYCAKYDRLAGGDEVFCDQLHYAAVQEEDDDEVPFTFRHPYHFPLQKHRDLGINQN